MPKRFTPSNENQKITEIADLRNLSLSATRLYFSLKNPNYKIDFVSLTIDEVQEKKGVVENELEIDFCLNLLSSFEAVLRIDYAFRCQNRKRDELSRYFRNYYKNYGLKVNFEEIILHGWKMYFLDVKNEINFIITAFQYRHWIAHGRYWVYNKKRYDFDDLYIVIERIMNSIPIVK
ncbi:MAG: hypothetical protein HPY53_15550 [Brevinematales bacterium]|nr:hypothetical protein [Brevinematales bacterium]